MRSLPFVIGSFGLTILSWGLYGPVLHWGQDAMSTGGKALFRPFVCVGMAYFLIGVVVPIVLLKTKGEKGHWTVGGAVWSFAAGIAGALGALGIILAFKYGGAPSFVMPIVFGGAPVINAFITIYLARTVREIGPIFLAGMIMVIIGSVTVLLFSPKQAKAEPATAVEQTEESPADEPTTDAVDGTAEKKTNYPLMVACVILTVLSWGAYGPVLHLGQAAMDHSRFRPLLCVGLAYFLVAVIVPNMLLLGWPEQSEYNFWGTILSLAAGAAGAVGALGIIMAFNFGGKPIYVMPLVFGGAPIVNTVTTMLKQGTVSQVNPLFLAGIVLAITGSAIVLVFAPRGKKPEKGKKQPENKQEESKAAAEKDSKTSDAQPQSADSTEPDAASPN